MYIYIYNIYIYASVNLPSLAQIKACRRQGNKPLSQPMVEYIVNWTPRKKLQWNFNQSSHIFLDQSPFENVVWKMVTTLSQLQCVKMLTISRHSSDYIKQNMFLIFLWESVILNNISIKGTNYSKVDQVLWELWELEGLIASHYCYFSLKMKT